MGISVTPGATPTAPHFVDPKTARFTRATQVGSVVIDTHNVQPLALALAVTIAVVPLFSYFAITFPGERHALVRRDYGLLCFFAIITHALRVYRVYRLVYLYLFIYFISI